MKIDLPKNLKGKELLDWLEHNSDVQHEETYFRPYDQSELDDARRQHAELSLKVEDRNKEFAEVKRDHAETCKNIRKDVAETLTSIRRRGIEETGRCYTFKDNEQLTVTTVNRFGSTINTRPMTPEEKQLSIDDTGSLRQMRAS